MYFSVSLNLHAKTQTMKKLYFLQFISILLFFSLHCNAQERRKIESSDFKDSTFTSLVDFSWAEFDSIAYFNGVQFGSVANFSGSKFDLMANFNSVHFSSKVHFSDAQFGQIANFYNANFALMAYFNGVQFGPIANFGFAKFDSLAYFEGARFDSLANFSNAHFDSIAYFQCAQLGSETNFSWAEFNSIAYFNGVQFGSVTNFSYVHFDSIAYFNAAKFGSKSSFYGAILPKYLNFSRITDITGDIELTNAIINPKYEICNINLIGSEIDKIRFKYKGFKLWFPEQSGKENEIDYDLKANVYEELLKKQKDEGFTYSYVILDKEYREFQYTDPEGQYGFVWGCVLNWIDKNWWGYGYDKELIIRNVIIIYLFLSIVNMLILRQMTTKVYIADKINQWRDEATGSRISLFFKSIPFAMFYTAQIFFGFKFDDDKLMYKENLQGWKIFNLIYFFIIYLGGFVCLAYLANYVITV
jgi:hypothetical protein